MNTIHEPEPCLSYWRTDWGDWAAPVATIAYPCGYATIYRAGTRYRYQLETEDGNVEHVSCHESLSLEECAHRSVRALEAWDEGKRFYSATERERNADGIPRFKREYNPAPRQKALDDQPDTADTIFGVVLVLAVIGVGLAWAIGGGF